MNGHTSTIASDRTQGLRADALWKSLFGSLVETRDDPAASLARLALGIMILPHGMQKMFGAFGGYGFEGTMGFFTETMGIPWVLAFLAIAAEFFGGLGLVTGLFGRVAALGVACTMIVAAATTHLQHGFFMNWSGAMPAGAEGWEFHLLAVGLAAVVLVHGSGSWSVDRALSRRFGD